jgi:pantoate ligase / CMP/dCMP kinase
MATQGLAVLKTAVGLDCFLTRVHASLPQNVLGEGRLGQVGFVPTMGALHRGHLSLMRRARQENAYVIVSIFVNPLQFGANEDFSIYPRSLEADLEYCRQMGVDAVFIPDTIELMGERTLTQVLPPAALVDRLCGLSRPGHFQGVATIVLKLLHLVRPDRAYFGRKDAQQLAILQQMVQDLNLAVEIIPCDIVREASGLAYSSRNRYLSPDQYASATTLSWGLQQAQQVFQQGRRDRTTLLQVVQSSLAPEPDLTLDYLDLVDLGTLQPLNQIDRVGLLAIAAWVGNTRLIDNVVLDTRKPILAIDGPAGAGKSTVTRLSAAKLGLLHLDTGAMYRAITWLMMQDGISFTDTVAIADRIGQATLKLEAVSDLSQPCRVWVEGQDITEAIRSREVTAHVSTLAAQPAVRKILKRWQQAYGDLGGVAAEGRDMGTHVFPDAGLKIFLTASVTERAQRRHAELLAKGQENVTVAELVQDITIRDRKDSERTVAPLCKAADAIEISTDGLTIDEVTEQIVQLYQSRCAELAWAV